MRLRVSKTEFALVAILVVAAGALAITLANAAHPSPKSVAILPSKSPTPTTSQPTPTPPGVLGAQATPTSSPALRPVQAPTTKPKAQAAAASQSGRPTPFPPVPVIWRTPGPGPDFNFKLAQTALTYSRSDPIVVRNIPFELNWLSNYNGPVWVNASIDSHAGLLISSSWKEYDPTTIKEYNRINIFPNPTPGVVTSNGTYHVTVEVVGNDTYTSIKTGFDITVVP